MSAAWANVPLGEVIDHRKEFIIIDDLETYRRPRVQLHAQGIVLRDAVPGAQIKTKKQQVARAGEFLVAEIDAKVGGFGIVPDDLDGSIVSSHYFLYGHKPDRLDNKYLGWFVKTRAFREQVEAQGSTNYAAIRPSDVLGYEIPLPPLDEQRRIVARIEKLAAKVEEARKLNESSLDACRRLLSAMAHRADLTTEEKLRLGWQRVKLRDVLTEYRDPHLVRADAAYPNFGIYSFGRGLFAKPAINGLETSATRLFRARAGLFIFSRLFAFEGAYGLVEQEYDGYFVSNEYPMFVCDDSQVLSEFLVSYVLPSTIWRQIADGSGGLGDRRQRVQPEHFLKHEVLVPPLDWQRKIKIVRNRLAETASLQTETAIELSAMLPAILDKAFKGEL